MRSNDRSKTDEIYALLKDSEQHSVDFIIHAFDFRVRNFLFCRLHYIEKKYNVKVQRIRSYNLVSALKMVKLNGEPIQDEYAFKDLRSKACLLINICYGKACYLAPSCPAYWTYFESKLKIKVVRINENKSCCFPDNIH